MPCALQRQAASEDSSEKNDLFTFIYLEDLWLYGCIRELQSISGLKLPNTQSAVVLFNSIHAGFFIGEKGDAVNMSYHLIPVPHGLPAQLPMYF